MNAPLFEALDRLVPACDREFGDWQQVLAAAGDSQSATGAPAAASSASTGRRRLSRRVRITLALAVAAVTVLFATPAFGLRELILDFVGGRTSVSFVKSRPAPAAIKKRFLDIFAVGRPPGIQQAVLPAEAKEITFRGAAGQKRIVWVAPIRGGGFCSLGGGSGGCISNSTQKAAGKLNGVTIESSFSERRGQPPRELEIDGHVFSARVTSLTLDFQDGQSIPIPFVYVSSPINAGFYLTGIPRNHQQQGHWPTKLIARNANGTIVSTATIEAPSLPRLAPTALGRISTPRQRVLPTNPPVPPSAPVQQGIADGFRVLVGHNGVVQFSEVSMNSAIRKLVGYSVSYSCFRITREFGIFTARGLGQEARFADRVGFQLYGVGTPLDGCDIEGSGGHRWPDTNESHSAVEIAFTAKGRAFFADRAAARDLALFVRSARMQKIRNEPASQLLHDMKATYGAALARSRIRYTPTTNGITFTETSTTGKQFRVVVEHGRIAHSNVEPYAKVF